MIPEAQSQEDKVQAWLTSLDVVWDAYDIPSENESIRVPAVGKDMSNRSASLKNIEGKSLFYYDFVSQKGHWFNLDGSSFANEFVESKNEEVDHERVAKETRQKLSRFNRRGFFSHYTTLKEIDTSETSTIADFYVDNGNLILPLTDVFGNIVNAQTISLNRTSKTKFDKRFEKDGRTKGVLYYHASPANSKIFIVCEGWATGYSLQKFIHQHFQKQNIVAVSAMSSGNMALVADLLRSTFDDSTVIFAVDNDEAGKKVLVGRSNPFIIPSEEGQDFDDIRRAKDGNLTGNSFTQPLRKILLEITPIATLRYVNHNVGSGKTYRFVRIVKASEDSFIYVAPSHDLIEQTAEDIRKADPEVDIEVVTYKTVNNSSVKESAKKALEACISAPSRRIICLSHVTFLRVIPMMDPKLKARFRVYVDETLKTLDIHKINFGTGVDRVEESFKDFSSIFTINTLGRLISTTEEMQDIKTYGDRVKKLNRDLREELVTPGRVCSVTMVGRIVQYVQNGGKWVPELDGENQFETDPESNEELKVSVAVYTDPKIFKGFKTFTIMSAMFEQSPLSHLWRSLRVNVIPDPDFEDIISTEKRVGSRMKIYYCTDRAALGRLRAFDPDDDKFEIEVILKGVDEFFAGKKYLYQLNNEFKLGGTNELALQKLVGPNATSIPMKPEGLNIYSSYNNIACLGVINPSPDVVNHMMYMTNLPADVLRNDTRKQSINQALGRIGAVRDPNSTEEAIVVVVGKVDAEWLNGYYEGSELVGLLPTLVGKSHIKLTQEQQDGAEITKYLNRLHSDGLATASVSSSQVMGDLGIPRLRHQRAAQYVGKGWVKIGHKYWKAESAPIT